jgi:UDP-N-acetylglucosamine 2-epimerase
VTGKSNDMLHTFESILDWIDDIVIEAEEIGFPFIYEDVNIIKSCRSTLAFALFNSIKKTASYKKGKYAVNLFYIIKSISNHLSKRGQNKNFESVDIVFWPIEPTHINQQLPVANVLKENNAIYIFITDKFRLIDTLKEKGEVPLLLDSPKNYAKWLSIKRKTDYELLNILSNSSVKVDDFHKNIILDVLEKNAPSFFKCIYDTKLLLKKINPKVVVLGNDLTLEGATTAQLLKRKNIPTASIMHGNLTTALHKYHNVDTFFVYGNQSKEYLLELGMASTSINVSGAPYLDNIPSPKNRLDEILHKKLSLNTNNPYALVLLSGPGESISLSHHLKTIENLQRLSLEFSNIQFVVKLHRKDNIDFYTKGVGQHNLIIADKKQNLPKSIFSWFNGCSVVLTGASTAGNEALLVGVPVITMDFNEEISEIDFIKNIISLHVKDYEHLKIAINEIVVNSTIVKELRVKTEAYIDNCFYGRDAKAAERIAKTLVHMCEAKAP